MIISIEKEKLNRIVQVCLRAVSTRVTMPILSGLLLKVENGKLLLYGTDLEMGIRAESECDVQEGGSTVVSGRLFADIVKNLEGESVGISTSEKYLEIKSKSGAYKVRQMMPEDFPQVIDWEEGSSLKVSSEEIGIAIQQTSKASSTDEKRPVLTGTLVEKDSASNKIRMVATDSYRLAFKEFEGSGDYSCWEDCIVPTRALNEMARISSAEGGEVELKTLKRQAIFKMGDVLVSTRLIEGQFPNYKQLLPKGGRTQVKLEKELILPAIKRATIFSHNIKLSVGKDNLRITAEDPGIGDSSEVIPAEVSGEEMEIGFNGVYLSDGVGAVQGGKAVLMFDEPQKPAVIKMEDGEEFIYVIMPVRLR